MHALLHPYQHGWTHICSKLTPPSSLPQLHTTMRVVWRRRQLGLRLCTFQSLQTQQSKGPLHTSHDLIPCASTHTPAPLQPQLLLRP